MEGILNSFLTISLNYISVTFTRIFHKCILRDFRNSLESQNEVDFCESHYSSDPAYIKVAKGNLVKTYLLNLRDVVENDAALRQVIAARKWK